MIIQTPNLVQTPNGFKRVEDVVVGDSVLSMGEWKEVKSPPEKSECLRLKLTSGFSITVEKKALSSRKQTTFVITKYRKFSDKYNMGFYAIPYIVDSGFIRIPKGDSRLYNSTTCLTRQVGTPNGVIGYLKPVKISGNEFSLASCLEVLESVVNRGLRITKKNDVTFKHYCEFGALCVSLLGINVWTNGEFTIVAPHSLYRMLEMLRDVNVEIPRIIFEKAINYNSCDSERYYHSVEKKTVTDWCLKGLKPDINGVTMKLAERRDYWTRLIYGEGKIKKTDSSN